jgi:enoyl-CoA hydratase/carnithine racemase
MTQATALPMTVDADRLAVVTIEPNQGPMVILDAGLIARLKVTFEMAMSQPLAGLVLASGSSRVFIAGADLKSIDAMSVLELEAYLRMGQEVFGLLCKLGCPTVAAINGAALGGGLELAMHCDGLVASPAPILPGKDGAPPAPKPYPIGLPEAGLAICPGWGGTNLLPARIDAKLGIERTCLGKPFVIDDAQAGKPAAGLIDAFAADSTPAALIETAKLWLKGDAARKLAASRRDGQPSRWIGRDMKRTLALTALNELVEQHGQADPAASCLRAVAAGLERGWMEALRIEREELNRLRNQPAGKGAIGAFLNKSK